jgi:hypothetical protein
MDFAFTIYQGTSDNTTGIRCFPGRRLYTLYPSFSATFYLNLITLLQFHTYRGPLTLGIGKDDLVRMWNFACPRLLYHIRLREETLTLFSSEVRLGRNEPILIQVK